MVLCFCFGFFGLTGFQKRMNKIYKAIIASVLVLLLILIRYYEKSLFYDPFLIFFENDYLYAVKPKYHLVWLLLSILFRYALNTIISLAILYVVFNDKDIIKFSVLLYSLAFAILICLFLYFLVYLKQADYYLFFVVRRFLIQPLILIFLLPAFYYQKLTG